MPRKLYDRDRRREAIVEILTQPGQRVIVKQKHLLAELRKRGFQLTQSSLSRDLRDLGAYRENGHYVLPPSAVVAPATVCWARAHS